MQPVHENEQHEQARQQTHPDPCCEEASTVTGVGEICSVGQTEALNLHRGLTGDTYSEREEHKAHCKN